MEPLSTATTLNVSTETTSNDSLISGAFPQGCIVVNVTARSVPWDNPNKLISLEVMETWERILHGVFLPVLFLVSIPTNTLNMVIFFKQGLKERINLCLFFLSLADLVNVTQAFCLYADRVYLEITRQPRQGALIQFMLNNNFAGMGGFGLASSWMTTIIACERCFCVVSPLRSQTVLKTKTMWIIILLSFAVLLGTSFLSASRWSILCVYFPRTQTSALAVYPSDFFLRNKDLIDTLDAVVYGVIIRQFCMITVIATTVITVVRLRSMAEWRKKSSVDAGAMSSRDIALTKMLVGTSVLYIVLFTPGICQRITSFFVKELSLGGHYYNMYNLLKLIGTFFSLINSSFNFFIYYTLDSKFRATLKALCSRRAVMVRVAADK